MAGILTCSNKWQPPLDSLTRHMCDLLEVWRLLKLPGAVLQVVRDRVNGESRGFAFMTFAHASCAASAMVNMNGAVLYGPFSDFALRVAPSARDQQTQVLQPLAPPADGCCHRCSFGCSLICLHMRRLSAV